MADELNCTPIEAKIRQELPLTVAEMKHASNCPDCLSALNLERWLQEASGEVSSLEPSDFWQKIRPEEELFRKAAGVDKSYVWLKPAAAFIGALLLFLCARFFVTHSLRPTQADETVFFSLTKGKAEWKKDQAAHWEDAKKGSSISAGSRIKVKTGGEAKLVFLDGSSVRIAGPSELVLSALRHFRGKEKIELFLAAGRIVVQHKKGYLVGHTPLSTFVPVGTVFSVKHIDGKTTVVVIQGRVRLTNSQGTAILSKNTIGLAGKTLPPVSSHLVFRELDPWTRKAFRHLQEPDKEDEEEKIENNRDEGD